MSRVTDVILLTTIGDCREHLPAIDAWLDEHARGQRLASIDTFPHGGHKRFESECFAAALNHVDLAAFTAFLRSLPWEESATAQLCSRDDHEERFSLVDLTTAEAL